MPSKPHFKACVLAVAMAMLPWSAGAAGLGRLNVLSGLGQPFRGEIELIAVQPNEAESLKVALAPSEAYVTAQLPSPPPSLGLRFAVNKRESGKFVVNVSSVQAIDEPVFNLLVDLSWSTGLVRREYSALIDPAGYSGVPGGASVSPLADSGQAATSETVLPGTRVAGAIRSPSAERSASRIKTAPVAASGVASQPAAQSAARYKIKSGDTLSRIAGQVRPEGVSLEQVLLGLYQANPSAFEGNMNRLKRGKILQIPSAEQLGEQDKGVAVKEVKAHAANWQNYRRQLAEAAAKGPAAETGGQAGAGRITAKLDDRGAQEAAKSKDVLKLSRGASKGDAQQGRVRALEEEAAARQKSLNEANQRVNELQKNVQEMEKLAALKSQQGAELQKKAEQIQSSAPASAPVVAPIASAPVASAASSAAQPKPKRVAPPPPPPEPGIVDILLDNAMPIGGGLLAIMLGAGGLLWARKRRNSGTSFEDNLVTHGDLKANTVLGRTGGGVISTQAENSFLTDFSRQGLGTIDTAEVDPIAEADVYMAYGRDVQAEEILKDALIKDPQRQEIRLKLLDIYAARKDKVSFQEVAAEVFAATDGKGPLWDQASHLGRSLDPENPLYVAQSKEPMADTAVAAGLAGMAAAAVVSAVTDASADQPEVTESPNDEVELIPSAMDEAALDFEFELPEPVVEAEPQINQAESSASTMVQPPLDAAGLSVEPLAEIRKEEDSVHLDFDLDESFDLAEVFAEPSPELEAQDGRLMELDLPIELVAEPVSEPVVRAEAVSEEVAVQGEENAQPVFDAPDFEMPDLDLDLAIGDEIPEALADETAFAQLAGLETELTDLESALQELPQEAAEEEVIDLDFGFDLPEPPATPLEAKPTTEEFIDLSKEIGQGVEGLDLVADDPVQTKIELARAYIDMGDVEGAREILQEAVLEGKPDQQEKARNLLAAL